MIILRSDDLMVRIDPAHGGEILDLIELRNGRQLLGRVPFGTEPPLGGDLDEMTWVRRYRGGWQSILPNSSNACDVDGDHHGFHGSASIDPWTVGDTSELSTTLSWRGHGLHVIKRIAIEDGALAIRYRIANDTSAPVPLIALDHLTAGIEILHPSARVAFPAALAYELDGTTGPLEPPAHAHGWPEIALLDGSTERGDVLDLAVPRRRLSVLQGLAEGWAAVWSETRGQGLALAWDRTWYPHCWLWHENRISGDPWREQGEILGVEPSSVPHALGLAAAIEAGQAHVLAPGEVAEPWILARPFIATGEVRSVSATGVVGY